MSAVQPNDATVHFPTLQRTAAPTWWMLCLVAVVALGTFANSLANGFAFDDLAIAHGQKVIDLQWTGVWTDSYWPKTDGIQPDALYRPLTIWSYLANQAVTPDVAWPFHLVNILLHALVSVLVSIFTWRLLGNRTLAVITALLFAVHPIHVEAIANVVGRAELLAALWSLLALLIFLPQRPLMEETAPVTRSWWHGILVALCFFAALLSKETPVTLLLTLPLIDQWRWMRWNAATRPTWRRWVVSQSLRYYLPMCCLFAVYLVLRIGACGLMSRAESIHHLVNPLVQATPLERAVTPFMLLAKYLWITFWPLHLSADYSLPSLLPTINPFYATKFQPPAALGMLFCVAAVALAIRTWRRAPQVLLMAGLFATSYMLVANFLRIGTIFGERLFYWPSVFVLMGASWAFLEFHAYLKNALNAASARMRLLHGAALTCLAGVVLLMGWRSFIRNTDWTDNIALSVSTARDNPQSAKACSWAGSNLILSDNPSYVEFGKTLIERAVELAPDSVMARWQLAKYYGMHHDMAYSAICIAAAVRVDPGTHVSRVAVPALIDEMRTHSPAEYMPVLESNLCDHPADETAYLALAYGYHAQKQYDQAEIYARKAIDMSQVRRKDGYDQYHEAAAELATLWFEDGRQKEGIDKFRVYSTYMGTSVDAHVSFASMLLALDPKKFPEALGEAKYNIAIADTLDPANDQLRELHARAIRIEKNLKTTIASASDDALTSPNGEDTP